ncbi:ATP-binding cassette domain-containing protein [Leptospira kanakyensis]|uniref:ATP-binding cassette domain-containing protein n=1 Tax=Leptospira kanakyensis TaxID=2484968 RepID=A0A6N4PZ90_9LEPT|nr:ATP-binding cassette domain-containing protein [Leptospira kanakyensis]TGK50684.1 ATP-binding cassette domain-containing protein [Leptospira kanakyensis]TGK63715.1 ATP-binding cassette domain-containing protein [Leptospira kanakyensis]TGK69822.1 ATP-binding cassette domain-containing protein [Leptospira kanakyensis]
MKTVKEIPKVISDDDFLSTLSSNDLKKFLGLFEFRSLVANDRIGASELEPTPILFLETGRIQVKLKINEKELLIKTLTEGSFYGVSELSSDSLKKQIFQAEENSKVRVLSSNLFLKFIESDKQRKQSWNEYKENVQLRDELRIHPYFRKLSNSEIEDLSKILVKQKVSPGQILIKEGSKSSSLFFIRSGRFKVTKSTWQKDYFSFVEAGSVLGEMGVLEKKARNATVTAVEESFVYELSSKDATNFFKKSESLLITIRSIMSERKLNLGDGSEEDKFETSSIYEEDQFHFLPKQKISPPLRNQIRFPFLFQDGKSQSGDACRKMLFRYWGYSFADYDADPSFPDFDPDIRPSHWKGSFGESKGDCYFVNWKDHESELNNNPTINFFENSKYIILKSIGPKKVLILDPEFGEISLSREEWEKKSSNVVIYFVPKVKPEQNFEWKNRFFSGLAEYFLPAIKYLKAGIVASFVIKGLEVFIPLINLYLIDAVLLKENKEFFLPVILVVVLLSFSQSFLAYFRSNVIFFTSNRVNQTIAIRFLVKLISLPISFFERNRKGEILNRWEEIESVILYFSDQGAMKIFDLLFSSLVFIIFLFLSPLLLLIIGLLILPEMLILRAFVPRIVEETKKESLKKSDTLSYFIETINGFETIKNLGATYSHRWDFEKRLTTQLNSEGKKLFYSNLLFTNTEFFKQITVVIVLLVGSILILKDQMTLGTLYAIIGLVAYIRNPIVSLYDDFLKLQKANVSWNRLRTFESLDSEITDRDNLFKVDLPEVKGNIQFKNLSFSYDTLKPESGIRNLNIKIQAGKKVAFVGRSGSGKSTILKLILGLYNPHEGEIIIDDVSLDEIWLPSLRTKIGVLFQENPLIAGTVRENISITKPEATLSEVVEAAKLACIHDDIVKLPLGYDTEISERGFIFSGGQKQRVSLARLFLQKPSVLLLDEPTAALDKETESRILSHLNSVFANATIITVAHRLDTIRNYDQIFVLERGKLEGKGTHRELLSKGGIYQLLHSKQEAIR